MSDFRIVFAGLVARTEKMTETGLNATGKDWTSGCGCTNPETFGCQSQGFV